MKRRLVESIKVFFWNNRRGMEKIGGLMKNWQFALLWFATLAVVGWAVHTWNRVEQRKVWLAKEYTVEYKEWGNVPLLIRSNTATGDAWFYLFSSIEDKRFPLGGWVYIPTIEQHALSFKGQSAERRVREQFRDQQLGRLPDPKDIGAALIKLVFEDAEYLFPSQQAPAEPPPKPQAK